MNIEDLIAAELDSADAIHQRSTDEKRAMTDEERTAYRGHLDKAKELEEQRELQASAKSFRSRQADAVALQASEQRASGPVPTPTNADPADADLRSRTVVHGSPVYRSEDKYTSYFLDMRDARKNNDPEAWDRLRRHSAWEKEQREQRAGSSSNGSGGELIAPVFLQSSLVTRLTYSAVLANLCRNLPLPEHTGSVSIPRVTSGMNVGATTELSALPDGTVSTDKITSSVVRRGGSGVVSNILLKRSMPGIDEIVMEELAKDLAIDVDNYVITQLIANMVARTYSGSTFTFAGFWPIFQGLVADVNAAVKGEPTAVVAAPRRMSYLRSLLDGSGRPVLPRYAPQNAPGSAQQGAQGLVGDIDGIDGYKDGNIPLTRGTGTNEDVLFVGAFDEVWLMQDDAEFAMSVDAEFLDDETAFRVTKDICVFAQRRAGAIGAMTGGAMSVTL